MVLKLLANVCLPGEAATLRSYDLGGELTTLDDLSNLLKARMVERGYAAELLRVTTGGWAVGAWRDPLISAGRVFMGCVLQRGPDNELEFAAACLTGGAEAYSKGKHPMAAIALVQGLNETVVPLNINVVVVAAPIQPIEEEEEEEGVARGAKRMREEEEQAEGSVHSAKRQDASAGARRSHGMLCMGCMRMDRRECSLLKVLTVLLCTQAALRSSPGPAGSLSRR